VACGGVVWAGLYHAVNHSETKIVLTDVSGADIEVKYTNSDALAKEETISVYISEARSNRLTFRHKTLLFRYDPGSEDEPLPSIASPTPNRLLISVPRISSISYKQTQWRGITVAYQIGRIDYP
jgi:hypothetical protein